MIYQLISLIRKEFLAIWSDKRSRIVIIVPPIIMLVLFSFAITMEVKNINIGVLDRDNSTQSQELIRTLKYSDRFTQVLYLKSYDDLKEKIDPYLRPLYDALGDMIPSEKLQKYIDTNIIEIVPLAFMRGRTLDNCVVILDEAQNSTEMQLKMFLTRMGPSAKMIINGDLSQIDLPSSERSGLLHALQVLKDIKGIAVVKLDETDIVRHSLVVKIVKAYSQNRDQEMNSKRDEPRKIKK